MQQQGIAPDHVSLAARIAEQIGELPAIATHAWSDDAACAVAPIRPSSVVCVSIAVMDDQGRLRRVDEVGAWSEEHDRASLSPLRERFNVVPRLGWSLGEPTTLVRGPVARLLSTTVPAAQWGSSPQGRLWNSLGAVDLVVGAAALDPSNPSRAIIVEVGVAASARPLGSADAAVLQGALGPLSRRARLAFGSEAGEPVRRLTPREEEVLEHLALGKSVKQIASELRRSPHTVHDHVKSLHVKLHASSRGELIARALGHLKPSRDRNGSLAVQSA
jgi:DNA-binding CsgD family transcriptional regulator